MRNPFPRTHILLITLLLLSASAEAQWERLPGPFAGEFFLFATGPDGRVYAGSEFNGLWRSSNDGVDWQQFGPENVGGLLISAVTREGAIIGFTDDDGGLFRSTDEGLTWERTSSGLEDVNGYFVVQHQNGSLFTTSEKGIYYSSDLGDSWFPAGDSGPAWLMSVAPNGELWAGGSDGDIVRSIDTGRTWQALAGLEGIGVFAFAYPPDGSVVVGTEQGLWRSTDGQTFEPYAITEGLIGPLAVHALSNGELLVLVHRVGLLRVSADGTERTQLAAPVRDARALAVAGGTIIVGYEGRGIRTSIDGGTSFQLSGIPYAADVHRMTVIDDEIFGATRRGSLYRTSDVGTSWLEIDLSIDVDGPVARTRSGRLLVVANELLLGSADDGASWEVVTSGEVDGVIDVLTLGDTILVTSRDSLLRSSDDGTTWSTVREGALSEMTLAPGGDVFGISLNGSQLVRSSDAGLTWSETPLAIDGIEFPHSLLVDSDGVLYLLARSSPLAGARSTDNGATWTTQQIDCGESGAILVRAQGGPVLVSACGVGHYVPGANEWAIVLPLPDDTYFFGAAAMPASGPNDLLIGTNDGVYRAREIQLGVDGEAAPEAVKITVRPSVIASQAFIELELPVRATVALELLDLRGTIVATLTNGVLDAGLTRLAIDVDDIAGDAIANGAYILSARSGSRRSSVLVRIAR